MYLYCQTLKCSPLEPLSLPNTIGPHPQNKKRLLSASQIKVFLCSRMKSEKHNGLARACSSVCPPVAHRVFYLLTKTLGNDACHASLSVTAQRALRKNFGPSVDECENSLRRLCTAKVKHSSEVTKGEADSDGRGDTERLFGTSWRLHQPQPGVKHA